MAPAARPPPSGRPERRLFDGLRRFLHAEATGGVVLLLATGVALLVGNSRYAAGFEGLWRSSLGGLELRAWMNEGLMASFFLLVGLELKRELVRGQLASRQRALLPVLAALGGMAVPALVYRLLILGAPAELGRGWAIPTATDIGFTVGVMALLGRRLPLGLKMFVMALAIADDLGAVLVLALFYSQTLHALWLGAVMLLLGLLLLLQRQRVDRLLPYLGLGVLLWVAMLRSGVPPTLAGVLLGFSLPLHSASGKDDSQSPLERLAGALEYPVALGVLPLFALANAGLPLDGASLAALRHGHPEVAAIFFGLLVGKPLGIGLAARLAVRSGLAKLPAETSWRRLFAAATLCGIGFTMSIFTAQLAFADPAQLAAAKLAILAGSLAAALLGALLLLLLGPPPKAGETAIASQRAAS